MKVCMILTDGFEEVEAVGTYAILRRGGLDVDIYSLAGATARGRFGLFCADLKPFATFDLQLVKDYAAVVIPGGPQYKALEASADVHAVIKSFYDSGKWVCAICAGPTILGRAGYLKGRKYTCFTAMDQDFGGSYQDDYTVTDGKIITGKSAAATIAFAFAILSAVAGAEAADKTKKEIYYKG